MAEENDVENPSSEGKRKFSFPTAFTILFILLILIAAATWIIPAGSYDYDEDGEPIPGTYHQVPSNPQRLLASALKGPINGMYGIEDETGNVDVWNSGELFGAIDVAMFVLIIGGFLGVTMKTGAINAGIAWVVAKLKGKEKWMFPDPDDHLRHRRHDLWHGRGDAGLLRPDHHGDARRRLRRAGRRRLILLGAGIGVRLHRQPLCHRHRLRLCRNDHQRGVGRTHCDPGHRHDHRHRSL